MFLRLAGAAAQRSIPRAWRAACAAALLAGCSTPSSGPSAEERQELAVLFQQFLRDDPRWPETREHWLARDDESRRLLVDALYVQLISSGEAVAGSRGLPLWARAQRELEYVGHDALVFLVEALKFHAERSPVDLVAVDRITRALAEFDAQEELSSLLADPASGSELRLAAVRTLGFLPELESPGPVVRAARTDPDWRVRAEAVQVLARQDPAGDEVRQALVQALEDPDAFVRESAARGLAGVRTPPVRRALVECYARAVAETNVKLAAVLYDVLTFNTGVQGVASDVSAWRRIIGE